MATAIVCTPSSIRCARVEDGRLTVLEEYPVPEDVDPVDALANAPLPRPLGKVRVLMQHSDLLLQAMVQPPAPADRLDRIIRFELQGLLPDLNAVLASWYLAPVAGGSDMRILVQVAKRELVEKLQEALKTQGGVLESLAHPGVGVFGAWEAQTGGGEGDQVLVDCDQEHWHIAFVSGGGLCFLRSQPGGSEELAQAVAELRTLPIEEARKLIGKLGTGAPSDIRSLIERSGQGLNAAVTAGSRFAQAQLKLRSLGADQIWLSGAGAQVPGFRAAASGRNQDVGLINPFAGLTCSLEERVLDDQSALPSPWTAVIGACRLKELPLDVMGQMRAERRAFWQTSGMLRAAAAIAVTILVLGLARQSLALSSVGGALDRLGGESGQGLVTQAQNAHRDLDSQVAGKEADWAKTEFLRTERRPTILTVEMLNAIGQSIDPDRRRVTMTDFQLLPAADTNRVLLRGHVEASNRRSEDVILEDFTTTLRQTYSPIASITNRGARFVDGRFTFELEVVVPHDGSDSDVAAVDGDGEADVEAAPAGRSSRGAAATIPGGRGAP